MKDTDINIGDKLRVRDWDDMVAEFGLDDGENIPCDASFITEMRGLCGKQFTVKEIHRGDGYNTYHSEEGIEKLIDWRYSISADMLRRGIVRELCPNSQDIFDTLYAY